MVASPKTPLFLTPDQVRAHSRMLREQAARLQKEARFRCEEIIQTMRAAMMNTGSRKAKAKSSSV